jgi:ankyrin repeat protein
MIGEGVFRIRISLRLKIVSAQANKSLLSMDANWETGLDCDLRDALNEQEIDALSQLGQQLIDSILGGAALKTIQDLIDDGAPLWYQNEEEGLSPLHAAVYTEREDVVKLLINAGAPWNAGMHAYVRFSFHNSTSDHTKWTTFSVPPQMLRYHSMLA